MEKREYEKGVFGNFPEGKIFKSNPCKQAFAKEARPDFINQLALYE
jgi:hypothetical protein